MENDRVKVHINWFPGHMAKAKRELDSKIKLVDLIIELRDARIPLSSANPLFTSLINNKPKLIILVKSLFADPKVTKLRKDLRRIQELANRLNLSKALARDAKEFFKKAQDKGLITNQRKGAIDCVCIYYSCIKNHQSTRREDIIAEAEDTAVLQEIAYDRADMDIFT